VDWVILGAETGHRKEKVVAKAEWILSIINNCSAEGIPLFIKNNAGWPEEIRNFPKVI
jgi:protein gp37